MLLTKNVHTMSFENFPSTPSPVENTPNFPEKNNKNRYVTIALVIALLGTWGYILWDKSRDKEREQLFNTQNAALVTEKDTLQSLLDEATFRYDQLKTSNAQKDSTITARDREIAQKKAQIQSILAKKNATSAELAQAKRLIASLNADIQDYKAQIETLKGENLALTKENQTVTEQRDRVTKNYDSAVSVIKQKENTIDVGSTLHASNFNITGIDERKSGKEKETTKAKRVDKMRISFDIDENRIAASGSKSLYICITAPDGSPIAVEALGSGKFRTRDGEEKVYTQKVEISYVQGQRQTVSFDWKQNADFITGDYKIVVYHNGFKIGEGIKHFRKAGFLG